MIDDKLAPVFEQLGQRLLTSGTVEDVLFVNLLPRQVRAAAGSVRPAAV